MGHRMRRATNPGYLTDELRHSAPTMSASSDHPLPLELAYDAAQAAALQRLQQLADALQQAGPLRPARSGFLGRWWPRPTVQPVRGLYLWGAVGRGKTWMMDQFFQHVNGVDKQRLHFHRFMKQTHDHLKSLRDQQNPLQLVAEQYAAGGRLLCLDEFFVADITDAMLLAGLLQHLFAQGVTLVTTSNLPPDDLYRDGLQRARFLPAIDLIKQHLEVFPMGDGTDYRLQYLDTLRLFYHPLSPTADHYLLEAFEHIAPEPGEAAGAVDIEGRLIATRRRGDGVIWFDFAELCEGPRSQNDYIELARLYHTVLLSNIPVLDSYRDNAARRFLSLVDEFYDRSVKLICSAAVPIEQIYQGEKLRFEYQRTLSRLHEMQSHEYLAKEHRP